MVNQEDILEAIKLVKSGIEAGDNPEKAVKFAASECEVPERVVLARFEKAYGVTPANFTPTTSTVDWQAEIQKAVARWEKNFRGGSSHLQGTRFFHDSEWWVAVLSDSTQVIAIRELDRSCWHLNRRAIRAAEATLRIKQAA